MRKQKQEVYREQTIHNLLRGNPRIRGNHERTYLHYDSGYTGEKITTLYVWSVLAMQDSWRQVSAIALLSLSLPLSPSLSLSSIYIYICTIWAIYKYGHY